jgi:excinuclease UvrABC ATPase subunit
MSKYTTQLRNYVEGGGAVFDFPYPIFDEVYRAVLESNIINHYYFREIGFETIGQFKHYLKTRMNIIMPYYNQLYETEKLITKDDYNINLNSVETHTRTVDVTSNETSHSDTTANETSNNKNVFSDTPQAKLQGLDYATSLNDSDGSNEIISSGDGVTDVTGKTTETAEIKLTGGGGVRYNSDVLMEWRKTFLNIDKMIIDELQDLFMNIY